MKKLLPALFTFGLLTQVHAQKIEVAVQANSGLFRYTGNGAVSNTVFLQADKPGTYRPNNPYGNKNAFSYGAGIQAQYTSRNGFIAGLQTGYEILRSKAGVNGAYEYNVSLPSANSLMYPPPIQVNGHVFLQDQDININPYVGYRIKAKQVKIDVMPGIDLGYNFSSYAKGSAHDASGNVSKADYKMPDAPADVRLRLGIAMLCRKWGITASYAHGLTNYTSDLDQNAGGTFSAQVVKSEIIRFGISYRIF